MQQNEKLMFWGAVSRAVRAPSEVDRKINLVVSPFPPTRWVGTDNADSEELLAYELGIRKQLGNRLVLDLSLFYNEYDKIRSLTPTAFPVLDPDYGLIFPRFSDDNIYGETYGFELRAITDLSDKTKLELGYSFLEVQMHNKDAAPDVAKERQLETAVPEQMLYAKLDYKPVDKLLFQLGLRYVDEVDTYDVDSYIEMDVNIAYQINEKLKLELSGRNLLDNHHPEWGFISQNFITTEVERSFFAKLTYTF